MENVKEKQLQSLKEEIKKGCVRLSVITNEKGFFEFYDFENLFESIRKFNDYNKALNFIKKYVYVNNKIEEIEEKATNEIKKMKSSL